MTNFGYYLAKNHATKNVIEPKWAPGAHAQYRQTAWLSATDWSFAGVPQTAGHVFFPSHHHQHGNWWWWARGALTVLPQPQLQGASGTVLPVRF